MLVDDVILLCADKEIRNGTMKHLLKRLRRRRQRRRATKHASASSANRDDDEEEHIAPISFDLPTIAIHPSTTEHPGTIIANSTQQSLPLLYSLAKSWAWQPVWFRCRTHPQEASADYVNENGDNVLHWTVFGNPTPEVVRELLKACPQLACKPNNEGQYPLHGKIFMAVC